MLAAMTAMFIVMALVAVHAERAHDVPSVDGASVLQTGGNMEGKETRFGVFGSALYAAVTTSGGDVAVNAMYDSFTPDGGLVPMGPMVNSHAGGAVLSGT